MTTKAELIQALAHAHEVLGILGEIPHVSPIFLKQAVKAQREIESLVGEAEEQVLSDVEQLVELYVATKRWQRAKESRCPRCDLGEDEECRCAEQGHEQEIAEEALYEMISKLHVEVQTLGGDA